VSTHSELNAWLMPPAAQEEWLRLSATLAECSDEEVPCRAGNPDDWWPDKKQLDGRATLAAADACRSCRARAACLDYALAADERFGIWAGLLPEERRSMRVNAEKTSPTMRIMAAS
jgi:WhiB family redox-sensing transcriptional regulator